MASAASIERAGLASPSIEPTPMASAAARRFTPAPSRLDRPVMISQSSRPPSRLGTAAGLKRTWFRTDTAGMTMSRSSRSSGETEGRITSA